MPTKRPQLILIDGHALAYQQYYAMKGSTFVTASGEPTNATFGFTRTLIDLLHSDPASQYLAVVFDQGLSGREQAYADYKSTRDKMDDALAVQLDRIREVVQAFNIPILEQAGYEADDVIGSVARQAPELGVDVLIMTGDQDIFQLITDQVQVALPDRNGGGGTIVYDAAGVLAKLGVRPEQIPDYKGLVGDSSDNIPGVKGIGEKTAVPLLLTYGTVEKLYDNLESDMTIKAGNKEKLLKGREMALLSKQLATIITTLPITVDLAACVTRDYDIEKVDALLVTLNFKGTRERLRKLWGKTQTTAAGSASTEGETTPEAAARPSAPASKLASEVLKTVLVDDTALLADLVARLATASVIAFDTETTGLDAGTATLVGISLAVDGNTGYYIPVGHRAPDEGTLLAGEVPKQLPLAEVVSALAPALADAQKVKIAHNASYDLTILGRVGLTVAPVFDTMIAAWLVNQEGHANRGLKEIALSRFNIQMTHIDSLIGKGKKQITFDQVPVDLAAPYASADAAITHMLYPLAQADLRQHQLESLFYQMEMPLVPVISRLNQVGARLDVPYLADLNKEFAQRLEVMRTEIHRLVGREFNIASPIQLNEIFFETLNLPTGGLSKTAKTKIYSIDAEALEILGAYHPVPKMISAWRGLEKLKNTYVDALPRQLDSQNRVHTSYRQTGAVTGRLSSDTPNLQNIPIRTEEGRRVRKAFIASEGYSLLSIDYSQIELRILAHMSGDQTLVQAFRDDQDIHKATAALVYGVPLAEVSKDQRYFAKRVNFGLMYGMGAFRLSQEGDMTRGEAQRFIDAYFERLPGVRDYLEQTKQQARQQGYLETLFGRRRSFAQLQDPKLKKADQARIEREAINMPIQGTAADIIKIAMIRVDARLREGDLATKMILQVHDELVFEVPTPELPTVIPLLRGLMEGVLVMDAPLKADANVGQNWAEMSAV
jgi:DNA polymerase I